MSSRNPRRQFITLAGALGASAVFGSARFAHAAELTATPFITEGPFYPTAFPKDIDNDLTRIASQNKTASGTALELGGRILDTRGVPIANAKIEIWQCDAAGIYHHVGYDKPGMDEYFQGYGVTTTDAEGRYQFRTIKPVPYPSRTPHIHYIVTPSTGTGKSVKALTSQMFIEGEARNERDFLYRSTKDAKERERLMVKLSGSGDALKGTLDVVLRA
jgi:protocatechuate 3,4-dioxygenase, beta subunit